MIGTEMSVGESAPAGGHGPDWLTLAGEPENGRNSGRVEVITALLNNAEAKVNHFDNLRQGNLVVAIAIFSGLFGFGIQSDNSTVATLTALTLGVVMAIFHMLNHRFHKYSEGWQGTARHMARALAMAVSEPHEAVSFFRYRRASEQRAKQRGFHYWLYLLLTVGGPSAVLFGHWLK